MNYTKTQISVSSGPRLASRLPYCASELAAILQLMCDDFFDSGNDFPEATLKLAPELELALVNDAQMAELNLEFLGCAGPTNVLAFPAAACGSLGWLALSPQTVRREAKLFRQDLPAYTLRLLAHGLGHLFGYDHGPLMDAACAKAMLSAQRKYPGELDNPGAPPLNPA